MDLVKTDDKIRELLQPKAVAKIEKKEIVLKSNSAISAILDTKKSLQNYDQIKPQLTNLFDSLKNIFDFAKIPMELRDRQFLNKTGYAMSPAHAITTINDVFRVSGFIRSIDMAIKDLKESFKDETLHIVYPACGPLAPLLLPLLAYYSANNIYSPKDIKVTFIDIQQGAVIALVNLLKVLQLDEYVKDVLCIDAVEYKSDEDIHLVVLEAMQHGFTKEGHLSISKHFASLLHKDGILLPKNVKITALLAIGEEEYNTQFRDKRFASSFTMSKDSIDKRVVLGDILEVNLKSLKNMEVLEIDKNTRLIECSSYMIPEFEKDHDKYIMLFATNIHIYKDEYIDEYDSGITHPLPNMDICINFIPKNDTRETDLYVKSGDRVIFYYKLVGLPGFLVVKGDIDG